MVLPYVRFWEGSINQIVCSSILALEKIFSVKLIIFFQLMNFCIAKLNSINVINKLSLGVIPEN